MASAPRVVSALVAVLSLSSPAFTQALTFSRADYASSPGARGIVAVDLNRDGWSDLALANTGTNTVSILLNQHGTGFRHHADIPVGAGPFDLAADDVNRDGIVDLVVANADGGSLSLLLGHGDGQFTRTDLPIGKYSSPRGVAIADMNGDGVPDVIFTAYQSNYIHVMYGDGAGGFTWGLDAWPARRPQGVRTADFNHDGYMDLAVAFDSDGGLWVIYGNGTVQDPRFQKVAGPAYLNVMAIGDLNGDGWTDVAAASTNYDRVCIFLNGPAGLAFTQCYATGTSPRGVTLADVNGDGRLDVITANRAANTVRVLLADPAHPGALLAARSFAAGSGSRAIAAADFDADGRVDLAVGNEFASAVTLLSNTTARQPAGFTFSAPAQPSVGTFLTDPRINQHVFAAADFNMDGRLDFVAHGGGRPDAGDVVVLITGGPTVVVPAPGGYLGHVVGDFNNDGRPDVLVVAVGGGGGALVMYAGDGHGGFGPGRTSPYGGAQPIEDLLVDACVAADANRDGKLDAVCAGHVLLGRGDGTFGPDIPFTASLGLASAIQVADFNRDGIADAVLSNGEIYTGDGTGAMSLWEPSRQYRYFGRLQVADLNHDGYPDIVGTDNYDDVKVFLGSADGYPAEPSSQVHFGFESRFDLVLADVTADGWLDLVVNVATGGSEEKGIAVMLPGNPDGTFGSPDDPLGPFRAHGLTLPPGEVLAADVTGDGLLDLVAYTPHALAVLANQRNSLNHPPVAPDYAVSTSFAGGFTCINLDAKASDPDQHALFVQWYDAAGQPIRSGMGEFTYGEACFSEPGTYTYRRVVTDGRGGQTTGSVTLTVVKIDAKEIVLYAADPSATLTGTWSAVADATAAGGLRAYDQNLGRPKLPAPAWFPGSGVVIPFKPNPDVTYKLWIRLKADANSWSNDSAWVRFWSMSGVATSSALALSLEECSGCGVSGWGWQDDGWGAIDTPGVLLRFPDGGVQQLQIYTREDGVSIDQVVLSAEKYLKVRPGAAKNDHTILARTQP